jgi:cold shock CspA family protein
METTFGLTYLCSVLSIPAFFPSEFEFEFLGDMFRELFIGACVALILKFVSSRSWGFFHVFVGRRQRDEKINSDKIVAYEKEIIAPDRKDTVRSATQMLGTVKSYSSMHEYGFICSTGVPDDLWFSKADVRPDELRWLRSGCVVTFMMQESVSTGCLRARSIELSFEGNLKWFDRVNHYGFVCPRSGLIEDRDIWFSTKDLCTPNCWMKEGAVVRFGIFWSFNGRPRARNVEVHDPDGSTWLEGFVKFFLSHKGHGFIVCRDYEEGDIWLSQDDLPPGHSHLLTGGVPLRFKLDKSAAARPRARDVEVVLLPPLEGLVKSFCDSSNYGFVSCPGIEDDVWFAAACVEGLNSRRPLGPGMRVRVEMFKTDEGKFRAHRVTRVA